MDKLTVRDADVAGKRVFVRVDFNVPIADGKVQDDSRIRAAIPTIAPARPGRREASSWRATSAGPTARSSDSLRLRPVGQRLTELIRRNVPVTGDALGVGTEDALKRMRPGEIVLLENLRFHPEEEANDPAFAVDARVVRGRLRQRRLRHGASRARLDRRHRRAPARLRGTPDGARADDALPAPRIARAPVRRDPRRREGQRQDRGHRQPAHEGRPARARRRHGQHLPARAGQDDRQEPRRARSSRGRAADPRDAPRRTGSGSCCRST